MYSKNIFDKIEKKIKRYYGFDCPTALTSKGWRDYENRYKLELPKTYFVFSVIDEIGIYVYRYVTNPWGEFWYGLRNRFVTRPTEIRIQNLSKWRYHDPSEILLHANFQVLVDFVEYEVCIHERPTWYRRFREVPILGYFVPIARDREGGLKHLAWECELVYNEDWCSGDNPNLGMLTPQAVSALEKRDLYLWWKDVRPNRPDPMNASGLSKYYEDRTSDDILSPMSDDDRSNWKPLNDECQRIEKMYDDEDENNLIRLAKIRQSLWT